MPDEVFQLQDIRLEIPTSLLTPEIRYAIENGYYEGSEIAALRHVIKAGDRVLELGGGIGFISAFVSKALKASAVCSVEANCDLIPIIRRTHELNGVTANVLHGMAAGASGRGKFHRQKAFWASSSLPLPDSEATDVAMLDTSQLMADFQPHTLVVDIEGGESSIFRQLEVPACVGNIMCEVHRPQIGGTGVAACFDDLHRLGFAYDPDASSGTNVVFSRMETGAGAKMASPSYFARLVGYLSGRR